MLSPVEREVSTTTHIFQLRMPISVLEKVKALSKLDGYTQQAHIRRAVLDYLSAYSEIYPELELEEIDAA